MVTHKEENAQKRDIESNSFHVFPVYCCLYLKGEKKKKSFHFVSKTTLPIPSTSI